MLIIYCKIICLLNVKTVLKLNKVFTTKVKEIPQKALPLGCEVLFINQSFARWHCTNIMSISSLAQITSSASLPFFSSHPEHLSSCTAHMSISPLAQLTRANVLVHSSHHEHLSACTAQMNISPLARPT
ncbi:hypothetical protein BsWGS_07787 [Bradybaena similaris]